MKRSAVSESHSGRAAGSVLRWIGIAVVIGIILAAVGPFGSYLNGGPVQRAGYWIAAVLLALLLYGAAFRTVTAIVPDNSRLWWPALIGAVLLTSVPEALVTRAGARWLWPELARLAPSWTLWFVQTATIGLVLTIGTALILRSRPVLTSKDNPASIPPIQVGTAMLGSDVLALQMEDHYVRVHRSSGSELLLMPLGRAIEGVESEGLRTHRSWWVASRAVAKIEGNARSMQLHLSNGVIAPVARSAVVHLKAAGWISESEGDVGIRDIYRRP